MAILTTAQVRERTGFSRIKIIKLINSGRLPAVNVGAGDAKPRWAVRECDLNAFFTPTNAKAKKISSARRAARIDAHIENKAFG